MFLKYPPSMSHIACDVTLKNERIELEKRADEDNSSANITNSSSLSKSATVTVTFFIHRVARHHSEADVRLEVMYILRTYRLFEEQSMTPQQITRKDDVLNDIIEIHCIYKLSFIKPFDLILSSIANIHIADEIYDESLEYLWSKILKDDDYSEEIHTSILCHLKDGTFRGEDLLVLSQYEDFMEQHHLEITDFKLFLKGLVLVETKPNVLELRQIIPLCFTTNNTDHIQQQQINSCGSMLYTSAYHSIRDYQTWYIKYFTPHTLDTLNSHVNYQHYQQIIQNICTLFIFKPLKFLKFTSFCTDYVINMQEHGDFLYALRNSLIEKIESNEVDDSFLRECNALRKKTIRQLKYLLSTSYEEKTRDNVIEYIKTTAVFFIVRKYDTTYECIITIPVYSSN